MTKEDKELVIKAFTEAMKDISVDVEKCYGYRGDGSWYEAYVNYGKAIQTFADAINGVVKEDE